MNPDKLLLDIVKQYNRWYRSLGDYSITHFLAPPRQVQLMKRYGHVVEKSVLSSMPSLIGNGVHQIIEGLLRKVQVLDDKYEVERTIMEKVKDRIITGRVDILYDYKHITDIKTCKTWALRFDPGMIEWHEQQNFYAWLFSLRGIKIESINILAVYLDWIQSQALREKRYPQSAIEFYTLDLWPTEETEEMVYKKLDTLIDCESLLDNELPICTPKERWENHADGAVVKYAVMKSADSGRAMRVLGTEKEAREFAATKKMGPGAYIEVRHARRKRCDQYCSVNEFCDEYKRYQTLLHKDNLVERINL